MSVEDARKRAKGMLNRNRNAKEQSHGNRQANHHRRPRE